MKDAYNQGLSHQLYTFVYEWNSYCPTVSLAEAYYMKSGLSIDVDPTYDPNNPFVNRDPRLEYTIITPRSDNGRGAQFVPTGGNHTGMKIRKWNDYTESTKNNSEENIILIRYADVLLMRAEALVESGSYDESEVVSLINQIRQRPAVMMPTVEKVEGTNLTSEQLIDIIRHERRVEFGRKRWSTPGATNLRRRQNCLQSMKNISWTDVRSTKSGITCGLFRRTKSTPTPTSTQPTKIRSIDPRQRHEETCNHSLQPIDTLCLLCRPNRPA